MIASLRLREEGGQVLVFVVLALGVLIAVFALVLSAGSWMRTKQDAQSVADAAALAGVQQLPAGQSAAVAAVGNSEDQNSWTGRRLPPSFPNSSTIRVDLEQDVSGFFAPLAGLFNLTIASHALASIQVPDTLNAVAPIVVVCSGWCDTNTSWSTYRTLWGGRTVPVTYFTGNPGGSSFAPIELPGISTADDASKTADFRKYVICDATAPSSPNCNDTPATAPGSYDRLCLRTVSGDCRGANRLRNALRSAADGTLHLVAIANGYSGGRYDVVGWGAATFANVSGTGQQVDLDVIFVNDPLLVDGKWVKAGAAANVGDFGIRAIALTG